VDGGSEFFTAFGLVDEVCELLQVVAPACIYVPLDSPVVKRAVELVWQLVDGPTLQYSPTFEQDYTASKDADDDSDDDESDDDASSKKKSKKKKKKKQEKAKKANGTAAGSVAAAAGAPAGSAAAAASGSQFQGLLLHEKSAFLCAALNLAISACEFRSAPSGLFKSAAVTAVASQDSDEKKQETAAAVLPSASSNSDATGTSRAERVGGPAAYRCKLDILKSLRGVIKSAGVMTVSEEEKKAATERLAEVEKVFSFGKLIDRLLALVEASDQSPPIQRTYIRKVE